MVLWEWSTALLRLGVTFLLTLAVGFGQQPELTPGPSNSQVLPKPEEEIMNGYIPYRKLTTDDFPIKNNVGPPEAAYGVQTFIHHYYNCIGKMDTSGVYHAYVKDWTVYSGLNKNLSGRKSKFRGMKEELPYAQAIIDINELYARRMAALTPADFPSGAGRTFPEATRDLENKIESLTGVQMAEARKEMATLEKATNSGQNKKRVRELSAAIKKRLEQTSTPSPTPGPSSKTEGPALYIPPPAKISPSPSR